MIDNESNTEVEIVDSEGETLSDSDTEEFLKRLQAGIVCLSQGAS